MAESKKRGQAPEPCYLASASLHHQLQLVGSDVYISILIKAFHDEEAQQPIPCCEYPTSCCVLAGNRPCQQGRQRAYGEHGERYPVLRDRGIPVARPQSTAHRCRQPKRDNLWLVVRWLIAVQRRRLVIGQPSVFNYHPVTAGPWIGHLIKAGSPPCCLAPSLPGHPRHSCLSGHFLRCAAYAVST